MLKEKYKLSPIIGIETFKKEETIDIEVEDVHAFHAINPRSNNFNSISHNSAHIAILNCDHPDIEKFIVCKQGENNKELTQFNISVGITKKFMEAAENNKDWDLIFNGKIFKTVKAKDLYSSIMNNAFFHNEPGVLFIDRVNEDNNAPDSFNIDTTNPCLVGDTKIETSKGIKTINEIVELFNNGESVKILSMNIKSEEKEFCEISNACLTKQNAKIIELEIEENGKTYNISCTPDHKIYTRNRGYVEAKDLITKDDIIVFT